MADGKQISEADVLLKAYYEALHNKLKAKRHLLVKAAEKLLKKEIAKQGFEDFDEDKYTAYRDACVAFVDERIETYNPVGVQYTFERVRAKEAFELELQLDWYDSRAEFEALTEAVREKAGSSMSEQRIWQLADELIRLVGAFPDKSIISGYEAGPALKKLPDYVVARVIEEIIR
ncbi:hypothetical protein ES703_36299 [subsurface metagenome]